MKRKVKMAIQPPSFRPTVVGTHYAVATGHYLGTAAAMEQCAMAWARDAVVKARLVRQRGRDSHCGDDLSLRGCHPFRKRLDDRDG